jgi:hypothetical protein
MVKFEHNGNDIPFAPPKDPDDTLEYGADWSGFFAAGEVISQSEWIMPAGLSKSGEDVSGTNTKLLISGGEGGKLYVVTNRVSTSRGQRVDRSFKLQIRDN